MNLITSYWSGVRQAVSCHFNNYNQKPFEEKKDTILKTFSVAIGTGLLSACVSPKIVPVIAPLSGMATFAYMTRNQMKSSELPLSIPSPSPVKIPFPQMSFPLVVSPFPQAIQPLEEVNEADADEILSLLESDQMKNSKVEKPVLGYGKLLVVDQSINLDLKIERKSPEKSPKEGYLENSHVETPNIAEEVLLEHHSQSVQVNPEKEENEYEYEKQIALLNEQVQHLQNLLEQEADAENKNMRLEYENNGLKHELDTLKRQTQKEIKVFQKTIQSAEDKNQQLDDQNIKLEKRLKEREELVLKLDKEHEQYRTIYTEFMESEKLKEEKIKKLNEKILLENEKYIKLHAEHSNFVESHNILLQDHINLKTELENQKKLIIKKQQQIDNQEKTIELYQKEQKELLQMLEKIQRDKAEDEKKYTQQIEEIRKKLNENEVLLETVNKENEDLLQAYTILYNKDSNENLSSP